MKEEYSALIQELNDVFEKLKKLPDVSLIIGGAVPYDQKEENNCIAACYGDTLDIANIIHSLIKSNPLIIMALIRIKAEEDIMNSTDVINEQPI